MSQQIDAAEPKKEEPTKEVSFNPWYRYSAVVAALILLFFGVRYYTNDAVEEIQEEQITKFVSADLPQLDTLSDGSMITLPKELL